MSVFPTYLNNELYDYLLKISLREPEICKNLREEIFKDKNKSMMMSRDGAQFLSFLIKLSKPKKCLELGTYMGYSSLWMALTLKEIHRDLNNVELITCDIDDSKLKTAQKYWESGGVDKIIKFEKNEAKIYLENLVKIKDNLESFDFIFVDADKKNYLNYFNLGMQLLKLNGIIIFDNTLWDGKVINSSINDDSTVGIRNLNETLQSSSKIDFVFLAIGDGLSVVVKK